MKNGVYTVAWAIGLQALPIGCSSSSAQRGEALGAERTACSATQPLARDVAREPKVPRLAHLELRTDCREEQERPNMQPFPQSFPLM